MFFDRVKYKQFAQKQLQGRWQNALISVLIVFVISLIFSIPQNRMQYSWEELLSLKGASFDEIMAYFSNSDLASPVKNILAIISTLVSFITEIALASFFLNYSRSPEPVSVKTFLEGFNKWGRGILAGLWQVLWYVVWMLPVFLVLMFVLVPVFLFAGENAEFVSLIITDISLILIFVIMIIKSIEYSHHYYLVAEFGELGICRALKISKIITAGHRMEIFVTHLTFLHLYLLEMITFGLAQLYVRPYTTMTFINIYHALLKDALENGKIKPEDLTE